MHDKPNTPPDLCLVVVVLIAAIAEGTVVASFPESSTAQAQGQVGGEGFLGQRHF